MRDLCLCAEATNMGMLIFLTQVVGKTMRAQHRQRVPPPFEKKEFDVSEIKYKDLDKLRAQLTTAPGINKVAQYCFCAHALSDRLVSKIIQAEEKVSSRLNPASRRSATAGCCFRPTSGRALRTSKQRRPVSCLAGAQ